MPGCIPLPAPQKLPFSDQAMAFIEPGITDRAKMESIFGKPDAVRNDASLSIYSQQRLMVVFLSQYGVGEWGTEHMLLVRYGPDDLVETYEVLRLGVIPGLVSGFKQGCTADEICVAYAPYQRIIVFDRPSMDLDAKLFKVNEDHCSVYLYYTDWSFLGSNLIDVCPLKETSQSYPIYEGSYFHWLAEPGRVMIGANTLHQDSGSCSTRYEFECKPGRGYFVHAHENLGIWKGNSIRFSITDPDEGKEAVIKRRMMLH